MRIRMEYVMLFFIACLVIGCVIVIGISLMPIDKAAVCAEYVNKTMEKCICQCYG